SRVERAKALFDPLLATLVGKTDPTGQDRLRCQDKGKPLAGKSTLNRLELTPLDANSTLRRPAALARSILAFPLICLRCRHLRYNTSA
ncbi:MAG: hypothetical protein ACRELF_15610, partial [Gemmataceae bacterium]